MYVCITKNVSQTGSFYGYIFVNHIHLIYLFLAEFNPPGYISSILWCRSQTWVNAGPKPGLIERVASWGCCLSAQIQCIVPVVLSAGMPARGLEDKISTGWRLSSTSWQPHEIQNGLLFWCVLTWVIWRKGRKTSLFVIHPKQS